MVVCCNLGTEEDPELCCGTLSDSIEALSLRMVCPLQYPPEMTMSMSIMLQAIVIHSAAAAENAVIHHLEMSLGTVAEGSVTETIIPDTHKRAKINATLATMTRGPDSEAQLAITSSS
ncbi:hypothetical protein [Anaplasma capra]|uniref:hypothetical protein n=1 Tax=Anaplasma capra TaxID=1562740 RepID=UPI0021D5BD81|nr:hypothetical protein [Anaplasma capra]